MAPSRRRSVQPAATERSTLQKALADGFCSALFVLVTASFGELSKRVSPLVGLSPGGSGIALVLALLVGMSFLTDRLGGALFNPANNAFLWALGRGSSREHWVRSVAQAFGGVVGAVLALNLLPNNWQKELGNSAIGVRGGSGLLEGAACEFVLGSVLAFVVLYAGEFKSRVLKLWLPLLATVLAVKAGGGISGPSLNPAFTFAWVFVFPRQSAAEHLIVYWLAPVAAGAFGGWAFRGWQLFDAERRQEQQQRQQRRVKAD